MSNQPKIYLAGPFRGLPGWNAAAFRQAEQAWVAAGWQVFSPRATNAALGYLPDSVVTLDHLRHVWAVDSAAIMASSAIALLPGWERSVGATAELALAHFLGLAVYDAVTMEPLHPELLPWSKSCTSSSAT
jgi:hypothetical protein